VSFEVSLFSAEGTTCFSLGCKSQGIVATILHNQRKRFLTPSPHHREVAEKRWEVHQRRWRSTDLYKEAIERANWALNVDNNLGEAKEWAAKARELLELINELDDKLRDITRRLDGLEGKTRHE
jgi:hypothetical protein